MMQLCTMLKWFHLGYIFASQPALYAFQGELSSAAKVLAVTQSTYPKELESGALGQRFELSTGTSILVGVRFPIRIAVCCAAVSMQFLERWPAASLHMLYSWFCCACGPASR